MDVKLISLTKPFIGGDVENGLTMSTEELMVYIARLSNPSNRNNHETADKLIGFMIKNKHWSPFDMVNMCVEVTTSKAVAIQILRHWSIKPQEFSQRYAEITDIEPIQLRKNGATNRQSSLEVFDPIIDIKSKGNILPMYASELIEQHLENCKGLYKALLEADVAKECARMVLPMATSTTLCLNGSLRSWIHYLEQRTSLHAQLEHREVAYIIENIFIECFPMTAKALELTKNEI